MTNDTKSPTSAAPPYLGPQISIEEEMRKSYLDYSMSVIVGRALPDVRDGLKPVHRRVLYGMYEQGNSHARAYKKAAKIVGHVIGQYHPHGDQAVYDTIVRLAQPWTMRAPLIDGQGNFGSIDGDGAAAMRYTEVRMEKLADELLQDLDLDTVDFSPTYDGSSSEPNVLPAKFPNLLVNGSDGIAVGMATKIPPHNLGEIIDATLHLIANEGATVADLMKFVKGPDFPTGALIAGTEGIRRAYETGRGIIIVRGRTEFETDKRSGREAIVITEIPFQLRKEQLVRSIADLVREKRLDGISDIRDESAMGGVRIVIELKRDAIGEVILNNLYKNTALHSSYGIVMLAIDHGQPRVLSLKEVLQKFILHRREVVTRRSRFLLKQASDRLHIVEGLLVATASRDFLDHVIGTIRASVDPDEAKWALMHIASPALYESASFAQLPRAESGSAKESMDALAARAKGAEPTYVGLTWAYDPGFSEVQAKSILDMRLQRLTGLQREELFKELLALSREVARLQEILGNVKSLLNTICEELAAVRAQFSDPRRTEITFAAGDVTTEDLIVDEPMVVTLSHAGYVKRTPLTEYRAQRRGGRGKTGATTKEEDFVIDVFVASSHAYLMPVTSRGKVFRLKVHEIPLGSRTSRGKPMVNLVQFQQGERLAQVLVTRDFPENTYVLFVTRKGTVKRTDLSSFSNVRATGIIALGIDDGDALVGCKITDGTKEVLISTAQGLSIRFSENDVRSMGRTAYGVKGITLDENDAVVSAEVVEKDRALLTVTENGYGKRTLESEYRTQRRGGRGIIDIKTSDRNGLVVGAVQTQDDAEVMLITSSGVLIRMPVNEISVIGRNTQGVRLITLDTEGDKVVGISRLPPPAPDGDGADDTGEADSEPAATDEPESS